MLSKKPKKKKKPQKSKMKMAGFPLLFMGNLNTMSKFEVAHDLGKFLGPIYTPKDLKKDFLLKSIYFGHRFMI